MNTPKLKPLVCRWDWEKMTSEQKEGESPCLCWNECSKRRREKEERIQKANGFWERLWAKLS